MESSTVLNKGPAVTDIVLPLLQKYEHQWLYEFLISLFRL